MGSGKIRDLACRHFLSQSQLQVYEALNALGATPWRVNMFVLEVMEAAMKRKLEIGKLPPYQNTPIEQPAKR